jgi:hypothetical protein
MHKKIQVLASAVLMVVATGAVILPPMVAEAATAPSTYGAMVESWYEGWSRLYVEFRYNPKQYEVKEGIDLTAIINKQTQEMITIKSSYEGGRGFTPADYWAEQDPCPSCTLATNDKIKGVTNLTTYFDEENGVRYSLFNKNDFLFVIERPNYDKNATAIVNSLTFTNPAKSKRFSSTNVALIGQYDMEDDTNCSYRGTLVSRPIIKTPQVLAAALTNLFKIHASFNDGSQSFTNVIAKTNLHFQKVTVASKIAKIYLTGDADGLEGTCDYPYLTAQLEETALQFPTVKKVQIFLNGKRFSA